MPKKMDLTGQRFGRLVALRSDGYNRQKGTMWLCKCDCGNITRVYIGCLRSGKTQSCGCLQRERTSNRSLKHGIGYENRLYRIWHSMKRRCFNRKSHEYMNYGGRGITMCNEWQESFMSFYQWSIENGYSNELTIDRIDNNGNYCPENCRWTDRKTQARNSRHAHHIVIDNAVKTGSDCAKDLGVSEKLIYKKLKNLTMEEFITYYHNMMNKKER